MYRCRMKILDRLGACWRLLSSEPLPFNAFDQIFKPLTADLLAKIRGDEFVIAYMYGVMTCFFELACSPFVQHSLVLMGAAGTNGEVSVAVS
jgi:hypothetical protein